MVMMWGLFWKLLVTSICPVTGVLHSDWLYHGAMRRKSANGQTWRNRRTKTVSQHGEEDKQGMEAVI